MMKVKTLSLALLTSALFSTNVSALPSGFSAKPIFIPAKETSQIISCETGNFKGEAKYITKVNSYNTYHTISEYRITKYKNQQGGNKANINSSAIWVEGSRLKGDSKKSADRMKQDGKWHSLNQTVTSPTKGTYRREFSVQFIFDKSGPDPRCSASVYF